MRKEYHVLTPESVDFVYELAGLTSRLVAVLIDQFGWFGVDKQAISVARVAGIVLLALGVLLVVRD